MDSIDEPVSLLESPKRGRKRRRSAEENSKPAALCKASNPSGESMTLRGRGRQRSSSLISTTASVASSIASSAPSSPGRKYRKKENRSKRSHSHDLMRQALEAGKKDGKRDRDKDGDMVMIEQGKKTEKGKRRKDKITNHHRSPSPSPPHRRCTDSGSEPEGEEGELGIK